MTDGIPPIKMLCHYVLRINRSRQQTTYNYTWSGHTLQSVDQHPYLGVILSKILDWKAQMSNAKSKAKQNLGLIKRDLHFCPEGIKRPRAYISLVKPTLEYASSVWYPYRQYQTDPVARKRTETSCPLRNKNRWIRTRLCNKGP